LRRGIGHAHCALGLTRHQPCCGWRPDPACRDQAFLSHARLFSEFLEPVRRSLAPTRIQAIAAHLFLREANMIKKSIFVALTALTVVGTVATTNTEAKANPIELGAAIVGGALYAGAAAVGAVTYPYYAAPHYVGPHYVGPYYHSCRFVQRYDNWGYYVRTERVCGY
jgi:hypothetical protein